MRAAVPGLPSPHPFAQRLPAVFQDDEFTRRFVSAFDDVLAPVFATLDCLAAYLDPALAPEDFLAWLAGWVALDPDGGWSVAQQRELVRHAVELHRWRGTARGVAAQVRLVTDAEVAVVDSGGCRVGTEPGGPLPDPDSELEPEPEPAWVRVTLRVADPDTVDLERVRQAVAAAVPAHVTATVEVTRA